MANDAEEKQPPAAPPAEKPAAQSDVSGGAPPAAAPAAPATTPAAPAAPAKPAAPAAATPPRPAAPAGPKPIPLDNELTKRYKKRFGDAIGDATSDRNQAILVVARAQLLEIARCSRDDEGFDFLADLTAVDWPRREKRFDVVLNLYSFPKNQRLRLKVQVDENEPVASVVSVWPTANWLEREVYDMFGIIFEGHPDLRRLLLPEEWQGFPLRKDYDILQQDTAWVRENLGIESGQ
ncbi:MAG: NADH-quinone oxidoreductase subunit C [Candidatus Acidiferrales bacterium]|jgi:NADH-quinone oxidoreductase subunit C